MCACALKCVRLRACERGAVCVCDVADVNIGKRAHVCAPLHVPVCAVVCGMVCARRHTADASKGSLQSHLTASQVNESSESREKSAYDDRMSLEHLCATFRTACPHARRASDHSCEPAAASSSLASLAVFAPAPHSALGGAPAMMMMPFNCSSRNKSVVAPAPLSVVLADGGAPAVLAPSPANPVRTDAAAPAVHALTLESVMRAFLPRLRRPGPLLPPLRFRLLPSPPLPAYRFPLDLALSALAPLLAMTTFALSPASAPITAPSFSVSVLSLLRLALALVLHGLPWRTCLPQWPSAPSGPQTPPAPAAGSCAGHAWTRTSPG
jgi:hypothetical protein